jgi:hypothetical protein
VFDPLKDQLELQAIRRKLNELRKEFEKLSGDADLELLPGEYTTDHALLDPDEATLVARRTALDEIEREAELLEERIAELEDRYGVNATFN